MFQRTTAINKILNLKRRIKGIQGGTSAGKTYGILPIEIDYAAKHSRTEISIVAESVPHLKRGALKDFKNIMYDTKRWNQNNWNSTDSKYTFSNGSYIEFFSADNGSKLRGGRRDRLYMNEANNMNFEAFTELAVRTKGSISLDWNPTSPFWFHEELQDDDDVDYLTINYLDNEACPESAINFILKAKSKAYIDSESDFLFDPKNVKNSFWANWYKVYGLGEIGNLEGVIFNNWKQINNIPIEAVLVSAGLDFGYTNDPTTLVTCYKYNGDLIFDECVYQKGLLNSQIAPLIKKAIQNKVKTLADSAEPKSIAEIKIHGVLIDGALKGKDSINYGIDYLQQFNLLITARSTNLIKELRNYTWDKDREGSTLNKPIDSFNHCIDAMRYSVSHLSKPALSWEVA
jgi:phage terminase large subunit